MIMLKILITVTLVLILTTSIYSQADAKGGFRGGGFGEEEALVKALVPIPFH